MGHAAANNRKVCAAEDQAAHATCAQLDVNGFYAGHESGLDPSDRKAIKIDSQIKEMAPSDSVSQIDLKRKKPKSCQLGMSLDIDQLDKQL